MAKNLLEGTEPRVQLFFQESYPERGMGSQSPADTGLCVLKKYMVEFISFIIIAVLVVWAIKFFSKGLDKDVPKPPVSYNPYFKKEYLLTKAEHQFFNLLQEIVENKYYIFPQVHLDCLLQVKPSEIYQKTFRNKIDRKSVDFVICEKQYLKPLLVIELDDKTHYHWSRQERDQFVNHILESTGIKCLRIRAGYSYNFEELKSQVFQGLL